MMSCLSGAASDVFRTSQSKVWEDCPNGGKCVGRCRPAAPARSGTGEPGATGSGRTEAPGIRRGDLGESGDPRLPVGSGEHVDQRLADVPAPLGPGTLPAPPRVAGSA